jgi:hypothetical protein
VRPVSIDGKGVLHMNRLFAITLVFAAVLAAGKTTFAQSKDFGGSWVLDVEKSGKKDGPQAVFITLTATEFKARLGSETSPEATFKLDGTETPMPRGGGKAKGKWEGNKIVATVISDSGSADSIRFSRDGAWLVMEGESESKEQGPMKFYFKKAPAKL